MKTDRSSPSVKLGPSWQPSPGMTPSVAAGSDSHSVITEYRLPPNKLEKAKSLYRTHVAMFVVSTIYGLALIIFVLPARLAPRFRAERATQRRFVQAIIFAPL